MSAESHNKALVQDGARQVVRDCQHREAWICCWTCATRALEEAEARVRVLENALDCLHAEHPCHATVCRICEVLWGGER
jgi:hypothetical protein